MLAIVASLAAECELPNQSAKMALVVGASLLPKNVDKQADGVENE
jgi:hypothetical protein